MIKVEVDKLQKMKPFQNIKILKIIFNVKFLVTCQITYSNFPMYSSSKPLPSVKARTSANKALHGVILKDKSKIKSINLRVS